jgi:hypothetical protein
VLGSDTRDPVNLVTKASILETEVVLVKGHLTKGGRAATAGAGGCAKRLLVPHILSSQLVILCTQLRVLLPLVLVLHTSIITFALSARLAYLQIFHVPLSMYAMVSYDGIQNASSLVQLCVKIH